MGSQHKFCRRACDVKPSKMRSYFSSISFSTLSSTVDPVVLESVLESVPESVLESVVDGSVLADVVVVVVDTTTAVEKGSLAFL